MDQELYEYPMTESEKAQVKLGMSIQQAFSGLDDIMAIAADPNTKHLVLKERVAIGQLVSRAQLIASFMIVSGKPGHLMVVSNG
jgi:hypothetical protein